MLMNAPRRAPGSGLVTARSVADDLLAAASRRAIDPGEPALIRR